MSSFIENDKELIDSFLEGNIVSKASEYNLIVDAMRYSVLGGKRLRGILVLEFAKMFGCNAKEALDYAGAVECIQAYSLIHDDLPCMDDDDTRRGKPSCHIAFGEANALLAGDALLTNAFSLLSGSDSAKKHPERAIKAVSVLSGLAGYRGMVGGQVLDLEAAEKVVDGEKLHLIHELKTVALIKASALIGCAAAGASEKHCELAEKYAFHFGTAFQIIDDILDFDGDYDSCELNSYIKIHGFEKAKEDALSELEKAEGTLQKFETEGYDVLVFRELLALLEKRMQRK